jgi:hypothetical protein
MRAPPAKRKRPALRPSAGSVFSARHAAEETMVEIIDRRITAKIDGDFVVFLIGLRINKPWKIWKWLPVALAMPKMLKELEAKPASETGFLGHTGIGKVIVQYWRSFDHLETYAKTREFEHWPAWVDFNRRMKDTRGDVGIWHETFRVRAGEYEAIYSGMPLRGLAKAGQSAAVTAEQDSARQRIESAA